MNDDTERARDEAIERRERDRELICRTCGAWVNYCTCEELTGAELIAEHTGNVAFVSVLTTDELSAHLRSLPPQLVGDGEPEYECMWSPGTVETVRPGDACGTCGQVNVGPDFHECHAPYGRQS